MMLLELGHDRGFLTSSPRGPFRSPVRLFGCVDESPYWNSVFALYRDERLKEAEELIEKIGVGGSADYALVGDIVFVEAATSESSEIVRVGGRLEVEITREDLPADLDAFGQQVLAAANEVRSAFAAILPQVDTLLTLLAKGAELPWATFHDGYFTPKKQYGKICLPMPQSIDAIIAGFKRGLMYQYAFEATVGTADLWVLEAATALLDYDGFQSLGRPYWARDLDGALINMDDAPEALGSVATARASCRRIGKLLIADGGKERFLEFLRQHAEAAQSPGPGGATSRALKATFHKSIDQLDDL